jgi:hypothetical protein
MTFFVYKIEIKEDILAINEEYNSNEQIPRDV